MASATELTAKTSVTTGIAVIVIGVGSVVEGGGRACAGTDGPGAAGDQRDKGQSENTCRTGEECATA